MTKSSARGWSMVFLSHQPILLLLTSYNTADAAIQASENGNPARQTSLVIQKPPIAQADGHLLHTCH